MFLALFMLCLIYGLLYTTWDEKRVDFVSPTPNGTTTTIQPFSWDIKLLQNGTVKIASSSRPDSKWTFDLLDGYIFDEHHKAILEKDFCFGKPDGSKIRARGQTLYDYLQKNNFENNFENNNLHNVVVDRNVISGRHYYYFSCHQNKIHRLYACPPRTLFRDGDCFETNVCTGRPDGQTFPDFVHNNDRRYYRECRNGQPTRKRCQPESFFYILDTCRPTDESVMDDVCHRKEDNFIFPLSRKKYIRCLQNNTFFLPKNTVETCTEGTSILPSWNQCYPDHCIDLPEGFKKAMPKEKKGDFIYSRGYYICGKDNRIEQTVLCATERNVWKDGRSGNLTHLPMVFDKTLQKCVTPSLCQNVRPVAEEEVMVPAYEFTKYVQNWGHSTLYDSLVGYRCENNTTTSRRFVVEPGQKIKNFRIVSACVGIDTKIPIGDDVHHYYDCEARQKVECVEPTPTFSMTDQRCIETVPHAHSLKKMPLFRLKGLSPWNNWMTPWEMDPIHPEEKNNCSEPESHYVFNYNVCSHPDCAKFPFLAQMTQLYILLDTKHFCLYRKGKIVKRTYETKSKLNFWSQTLYEGQEEERTCHFSQKIQSGNFMFDSTLFATCDISQPFVFCPSSSTKGIARLAEKNIYACVPNDDVYIGTIPADTRVRFLKREISGLLPEKGASYRIDNGNMEYFDGSDHPIIVKESNGYFDYWSNRKSQVIYRQLVNYPVNVFIKNRTLNYSGEMIGAYWMSKNKITLQPMILEKHAIDYENPYHLVN